MFVADYFFGKSLTKEPYFTSSTLIETTNDFVDLQTAFDTKLIKESCFISSTFDSFSFSIVTWCTSGRVFLLQKKTMLMGVVCLSINLGCQFFIQDIHNVVIRLSCFGRLLWFCWTPFLLQTVELVVIYFKRPKISFQYLFLRRHRKIFFFEVYTFPISNIWTKCWNMFFRYLIFEQNIGMYSSII